MTQLDLPFGGVLLLAEHDVQPVTEGVTGAGPGVVRGQRGRVQGPGPIRFGGCGAGTVRPGEVLQERLHHVPGRHLTPVQACLHAVGVALPEHRTPAAALVQARQQAVQVARELPHSDRELIQSHCSTPARPEHSVP